MPDQKERQAQLIQRRLADTRKALKVLSDPMNWDRSPNRVEEAIFLTTAAGKDTSHRVNPLKLAKDAMENLDEARRLLPRFLDEEKEPVTLTASMKGEGGAAGGAKKGILRGPLHPERP